MKSYDSGYKGRQPFSTMCSGCKHFQIWEDHDPKYQCVCGSMSSDCAARSSNASPNEVHTEASCTHFESGAPASERAARNSPSEKAVLDRKPMPKLPKLLITGAIVSAVWFVAQMIFVTKIGGPITFSFKDIPLAILYFVCHILAGTAAFTLLRSLKNVINQGATAVGKAGKIGGNLFGWIVSTLLPWVSPLITLFLLSKFVFSRF